jgi:hypothetical protein
MPAPGSIGYFVEFYFDDGIYVPRSTPQVFLLGPTDERYIINLYFRMKIYLAAQFRSTIRQQLRDVLKGNKEYQINGFRLTDWPTDEEVDEIFNEVLAPEAANILHFDQPDGDLRFFTPTVNVTEVGDDNLRSYIAMFMTIIQLRFEA